MHKLCAERIAVQQAGRFCTFYVQQKRRFCGIYNTFSTTGKHKSRKLSRLLCDAVYIATPRGFMYAMQSLMSSLTPRRSVISSMDQQQHHSLTLVPEIRIIRICSSNSKQSQANYHPMTTIYIYTIWHSCGRHFRATQVFPRRRF